MPISRDDRIRMERAHVLAWPALHTASIDGWLWRASASIDGWLWRASGGGSQRANSVSTIDFVGNDLPAAIDVAEARYRTRGAPTRFQTFDDTSPTALPDALRTRNYTPGETTVTMFKRSEPTDALSHVEIHDHPSDEWLDVYLGAVTESRRATNRRILATIQAPHAFFGCRSNGQIISTALCVTGFGCAVVECVATRADARRQFGATNVMMTLLSWAARQGTDFVGLQVVAVNAPALQLYASLGFIAGATNCFWLSPA
jgi:GNAT superfamily N-acetyltransferase